MSVAHIKTLTQARSGLLQLDPGAIQPGTGSGFLWDTGGHIVTNFHVVQSASRVKVTLSDQRTHDAALVGVDPNNDVAVLKLPAPAATGGGNEPISVGTSHDLMVGQKVFAIGNPFGLDQTLTGALPLSTYTCARVPHRCRRRLRCQPTPVHVYRTAADGCMFCFCFSGTVLGPLCAGCSRNSVNE